MQDALLAVSTISMVIYKMNKLFQFFRIIDVKKTLLIFMMLILIFECVSYLSLMMLGINEVTYPWTLFELLAHGDFIAVVVCTLFIILLLSISILYWQGGIERIIAGRIAIGLIAFVSSCSLSIYIFSLITKISIIAYPWQVYLLFESIPKHSYLMHIYSICFLGCLGGVTLLLLFFLMPKNMKESKLFGDAHFANGFEIQKMGFFSKEGVVIGKALNKKLRDSGYEHILMTAPTGSGKTTSFAIPNLIEWKGSVVVNDLKDELWKLTSQYREKILGNFCFRWAPASEDMNCHCYNPFYYVSDNPNFRVRDIQLIAETFIQEEKELAFWHQSSRGILLTLALYLFETKGMATFAEIHDLSKQEDFFNWLMIEAQENESQFSSILLKNMYAILDSDEKTKRNILTDFHARMSLFNDPIISYATSKNDFDFRKLRKNKMSVYIYIPSSDQKRLSPILTLLWDQIINAMSKNEPDENEPYGVLALLDEFGNMGRINALNKGVSFLRSYCVKCVMMVQYQGQIIDVYGREKAKAFTNSKISIAYALNELDDQHYFSTKLGKKTIKVKSNSKSKSNNQSGGSQGSNESYQPRELMTKDEISRLPKKKEIILVESGYPIMADKCYWFSDRQYKAALSGYELQN